MNERIKEFEKQCWDNQTNHLNAEKFAALVAAHERERSNMTTEDELKFYINETNFWCKKYLKAQEELKKAVEAEREACATVCDGNVDAEYATGKVDHNEMSWSQSCAIAIRARGEK